MHPWPESNHTMKGQGFREPLSDRIPCNQTKVVEAAWLCFLHSVEGTYVRTLSSYFRWENVFLTLDGNILLGNYILSMVYNGWLNTSVTQLPTVSINSTLTIWACTQLFLKYVHIYHPCKPHLQDTYFFTSIGWFDKLGPNIEEGTGEYLRCSQWFSCSWVSCCCTLATLSGILEGIRYHNDWHWQSSNFLMLKAIAWQLTAVVQLAAHQILFCILAALHALSSSEMKLWSRLMTCIKIFGCKK